MILFGFSISKFEFFPPKLIIVGSQKFTNSITGYLFLSLNVIQNGLNHVKMSQKAAAKIFAQQIIYLIFILPTPDAKLKNLNCIRVASVLRATIKGRISYSTMSLGLSVL